MSEQNDTNENNSQMEGTMTDVKNPWNADLNDPYLGLKLAYQPDFPLPTFAEIRRVVQDEWDEDMGKIDPDNASPTADSIGRETADADQEQKGEDAS